MKLQMSGLGNPEIVAVRKHFNTREIILLLLFCFHVAYTEEEKNEKRNKPPAFMSLMLLWQERYISGKNFLSFAKGLGYLLLCTCSLSCCCHQHLLFCTSDRSAHFSPPVMSFNWANYVINTAGRRLWVSGFPPGKTCQNSPPALWRCHFESMELPT